MLGVCFVSIVSPLSFVINLIPQIPARTVLLSPLAGFRAVAARTSAGVRVFGGVRFLELVGRAGIYPKSRVVFSRAFALLLSPFLHLSHPRPGADRARGYSPAR